MRGVSELITGLPTFLGSFSFFGDELHMIGHGLGHMICNLLDPTIKDKFFSPLLVDYSFDVGPLYNRSQLMSCISRWTFASRRTNPSVFDYTFDGRKHFNRAVDWQYFLLHTVPTMVLPYLKHRRTENALMSLVNACSICLQKSISPEELIEMER